MKNTFLSLLAVLCLAALIFAPLTFANEAPADVPVANQTLDLADIVNPQSSVETTGAEMSTDTPSPDFMQGPYPGHAACFDFHDECSIYCALQGYLYYSANCNNMTCSCYS